MKRLTLPKDAKDLVERRCMLDATHTLSELSELRYCVNIDDDWYKFSLDKNIYGWHRFTPNNQPSKIKDYHFPLIVQLYSEIDWIRSAYLSPDILGFFNSSFIPLLIYKGKDDEKRMGTVFEGSWQNGSFWFDGQKIDNVKAWRMLPSPPDGY